MDRATPFVNLAALEFCDGLRGGVGRPKLHLGLHAVLVENDNFLDAPKRLAHPDDDVAVDGVDRLQDGEQHHAPFRSGRRVGARGWHDPAARVVVGASMRSITVAEVVAVAVAGVVTVTVTVTVTVASITAAT